MVHTKVFAVAIVLAMLVIGPLCVSGGAGGQAIGALSEADDPPIRIDGDADLAAQAALNGWPGSGAPTDPYLISGLRIRCDANENGIDIANTTASFRIADCSVYPLDPQTLERSSFSCGAKFTNVTNGVLSNATIADFVYNVYIEGSTNVRVDNTTVSGSMESGMWAARSSRLVFENDTITGGGSGLFMAMTDHSVVQCNNVSYNGYDGLDLGVPNTDCLIRWNVASRNGEYQNGRALMLTGTGNVIYGNVLVAPGGSKSMPAGVGYGSVNTWSSPEGIGNYYGTNYDLWSRKYTSFLGTPLCSPADQNEDGISDQPFTITSYAGDYPGGPEVDHYPLISPVSPPRNLAATVEGNRISLSWDEPRLSPGPTSHYILTRDDGTSATEVQVAGTSYVDVVADVENWASITYTVSWASQVLTSGPSSAAVGQNPDRPTVDIVSDLGVIKITAGTAVTYYNRSLDPRSVLVEWAGLDSDSDTMHYYLRLDDGPWLDQGQGTNHTFDGLAEGNHTVAVRAVDDDGNQAETSRTFSVYRYVQMSVSCSPFTQDGEDKLLVTGRAWDAATGESLPDLPIGLAYTVEMGASWRTAAVTTGADGSFQYSVALEQGAVEGVTLVAELTDLNMGEHAFFGNVTYVAMNLPGRDGVFLTQSTSVLSAYTYASTWLKFTVTGDEGTEGITSILVPKSAVDRVDDVRITLDGVPTAYSVSSADDVWVLTFNYTHSEHQVTVDIPSPGALGDLLPYIVLAVVLVAAVGIFAYVRRRKNA